MSAKEQAEMYRLMRKVHRLKATRREQDRYMDLSRKAAQEERQQPAHQERATSFPA